MLPVERACVHMATMDKGGDGGDSDEGDGDVDVFLDFFFEARWHFRPAMGFGSMLANRLALYMCFAH